MSLLRKIKSGVILRPRRVLMFGTPGIGLSTFAASFPEPVFVTIDDSLHHIDCRRFPVAQRFGQVRAALRDLHIEPHGYRTVVIDPLDSLERVILDDMRCDRSVDNLGSIPLDNDPALAMSYWRELLKALDALRDDIGMTCLLIARAAAVRTADASTGSLLFVEHHAPALHRQASALIQSWCDEVLFATFDNHTCDAGTAHRRVLRTTPGLWHTAKNRIRLPPVMPMEIRELAPRIAIPKHPMSSLN